MVYSLKVFIQLWNSSKFNLAPSTWSVCKFKYAQKYALCFQYSNSTKRIMNILEYFLSLRIHFVYPICLSTLMGLSPFWNMFYSHELQFIYTCRTLKYIRGTKSQSQSITKTCLVSSIYGYHSVIIKWRRYAQWVGLLGSSNKKSQIHEVDSKVIIKKKKKTQCVGLVNTAFGQTILIYKVQFQMP